MAPPQIDNLYTAIFNLGSFFISCCGLDILSPDFTFTILSWIVVIDSTSYIFINLLNVFMFRDTLVQLCFCLVTYSFGFQGLARIYYAITEGDYYQKLYQGTLKYAQFASDELDEEAAFVYYGKLAKFAAHLFAFAFIGTGVVALIYPLPTVFTSGELQLPFGFVLPAINYKDHPGYEINYFYQTMQVYFVSFGFLGFQVIYIACILYICYQSELIQIKVRKFGFRVKMGNTNDFEVESKKIFRIYHDFLTFHMLLEKQYHIIFGFDVICIPFQTIVTLVVCTEVFWIPGFAIIFSDFVLLLFGCALGVFVETKSEELSNTIYSFPWHLIKAKDRKDWRFFLEASQNIKRLSCGGFLPLNFNTFLQTYKTVYSVLMFLLQIKT